MVVIMGRNGDIEDVFRWFLYVKFRVLLMEIFFEFSFFILFRLYY